MHKRYENLTTHTCTQHFSPTSVNSPHLITGSNTGPNSRSPTKPNHDYDTNVGESKRVGSPNETNASEPQERETLHLNPKP